MSGQPGVIIAGAAETDRLGKLPGCSTLQLHVEGALNAVADAGLSLRDIDGIATVSGRGPDRGVAGWAPAEPGRRILTGGAVPGSNGCRMSF